MQRAPKAKQVGGKSQLPKIKKLFGTTYNTKHQFLEMERIQNQPYSFIDARMQNDETECFHECDDLCDPSVMTPNTAPK